jgi:hypothetical protein
MVQSEQPGKNSFAYYVVVTSLGLIGVSSLLAWLWQPSFQKGYISIPFGSGSLFFSLWVFAAACFVLLAFCYFVYRTIKAGFRFTTFLITAVFGVATIVFCYLLLINFSYTDTAVDTSYEDYTVLYVAWPVLVIMIMVVFTLCFLLYQRRKATKQEEKF